MKNILRYLRAPFFTGVIIPVLIGTATVSLQAHSINIWIFLATLLGCIFMHGGANIMNDYFDTLSGADSNNAKRTIFSGGSAVIISGEVTKEKMRNLAIIMYILGSLCGMFLMYKASNLWYVVLILGLIGFLLGFFYTSPPLKIIYRGFGELAIFIAFGPLICFGTYFVQTLELSFVPILISIPIGLLITMVLWINQFPDIEADSKVNKNNWVVRLGLEKSKDIYLAIFYFVFFSVLILTIFGFTPIKSLFVFVLFPIILKINIAFQNDLTSVKNTIPIQAKTIQLHLLFGLIYALLLFLGRTI
ncbi:MAG: 1,4-dihydroxy-2-naphthoate octaprenyltransferase [Pseudomonadota bacterium]